MQVAPDNAPGQVFMESALSINMEETMFATFPGEGKEQFLSGHVSNCDLCWMMNCPVCCAVVPFTGKKNNITYVRECLFLSCPWSVQLNGLTTGRVQAAGCCDNGCCFCCCPCLTCSGHVKMIGLADERGAEKYTVLRELCCCWPICSGLSLACKPLCFCCVSMYGCKQYACNATEIQNITQPIYKGPWSRSDGTPQKVGEFVLQKRFVPFLCCLACPQPMKVYYRPTTQEGMTMSKEDVSMLSIVLQLYRGMPVPCKLCASADFQTPQGIPFADWGLGTSVTWTSVQEAMSQQ